MKNRVQVGLGIIVVKDGKVLLGKRKSAHGKGTWCFPGGHLEFSESWEDCAKRETKEETGIAIKNIRLGTITNDIFDNKRKHYITICMIADFASGEVKIMEPNKFEEWGWFEWNNLPQPLFLSAANQLKAGINPLNQS